MDDKKNKKPVTQDQPKPDQHLEALKAERDEYKNKYLRALADYQNFEKRMFEDRKIITDNAHKQIILQLLPFLDHLEKAEIFIKDSGLKMIREQFLQLLKSWGVEKINVLNQQFDPHLSEAVDVVMGQKDNEIVEVVRDGYKYKDNILRVAQVKVSKKTS